MQQGASYSELVPIAVSNVDNVPAATAGDDVLLATQESDAFEGLAGNNTASYENSTLGITANLGTNTASDGFAIGDSFSNIDNLTGSDQNDTLSGDAGVNIISGGAGADVLTGGGGDDSLTGGTGNDRLIGGAGNDSLDGGDNTDTAVFSGNWSDYTITEVGGVYTVVDTRGGSFDGMDTVTGVENFEFSDGTVSAADVLNDVPTALTLSATTIAENSAVGTVVAVLGTVDADALDTHSYALLAPSNEFEIVGNELRVKAGATLDFETANSHAITIVVTDEQGASYSELVPIAVSNVDNVPAATAGDDVLLATQESDAFEGLAGNNTANENSTLGITANLGTNTASDGFAIGDSFSNIDNLTGSHI